MHRGDTEPRIKKNRICLRLLRLHGVYLQTSSLSLQIHGSVRIGNPARDYSGQLLWEARHRVAADVAPQAHAGGGQGGGREKKGYRSKRRTNDGVPKQTSYQRRGTEANAVPRNRVLNSPPKPAKTRQTQIIRKLPIKKRFWSHRQTPPKPAKTRQDPPKPAKTRQDPPKPADGTAKSFRTPRGIRL